MPQRILAVLLAVAAVIVAVGVALWSVPAGLVTAGLLLAGWAVLFFLDVPEGGKPKPAKSEENGAEL